MKDKVGVVMPLLIREPWQLSMTLHAIECLRVCTDLPFELILPTVLTPIVRSRVQHNWVEHGVSEVFIPIENAGTATADINLGIVTAIERDCDWIVYTGNDVFVRPGWLEALFECFEAHEDCGVATLASADLANTPAGIYFGQDRISEGVYGPFMMFPARWSFNAQDFPGPFADSDLIMRIYEKDLRMFRNNRVVIQHLNKQSMGPDHPQNYQTALDTFKQHHGGSGLLMYRILTEGWVV